MCSSFLFVILAFFTLNLTQTSFAQEGPYTHPGVLELFEARYAHAFPAVEEKKYRIVGKAITNKTWGAIAQLCVGKTQPDGVQGCEKIRHAFFSVTNRKVFFGRTLSVRTDEQGAPLTEDLQNGVRALYRGWMVSVSETPFLSKRIKSCTTHLIDKTGWNWAEDGASVRSRKFWDYFFMVNFYIESTKE